jgi:hypothetical protein
MKHRDMEPKIEFSGDAYTDPQIDREAAAARDRVFAELERLDLYRYVGELEAKGYTELPPERTARAEFVDGLREALLNAAAADAGIRPDVDTGATHSSIDTRHGRVQLVEPLLHRDPLFEQALMNESALALVTYLLGESCVLFSSTGQIKGAGGAFLPLHADQANSGAPAPFPSVAQVCNAVWVLSDYDAGNGSTCFVPGSHRLCRHPTAREAIDLALFNPLEARAGSIIVWHGNTWHGAVPRKRPGLRLGVIQFFGRWYHNPGNTFARLMPPEALERNPPRFADLIGARPSPGLDHRYGSRTARFSQFG